MSTTYFTDLYQFVTSNGVVIPQTSSIREDVENVFKSIFGSDFSVETTTPQGRLIEAITLLITNVVGVNAQNANAMNPNLAVGSYLDAIGSIWNVTRNTDEDDTSYRARILASQSRGQGFVASIYNALMAVDGVTSVCVLDNNTGDVVVKDGISLPAHSVFICIGGSGYTNENVANAIYKTKSAGCAYQVDQSHGTLVTQAVADSATGSSTNVSFHVAVEKPIEVQVTVDGTAFTGSDLTTATKEIIKDYVNTGSMNKTITPAQIASAIALAGSGIVCTSVTITSDGTAQPTSITALPYQYFNISDNDITVEVP